MERKYEHVRRWEGRYQKDEEVSNHLKTDEESTGYPIMIRFVHRSHF